MTSPLGNKLAAKISENERSQIHATSEHVELASGEILETPGQPVSHCYFVERGLVSVVAADSKGRANDVGLIGNEGMTGLSIVLGSLTSSNLTVVRTSTSALRVPTSSLVNAMQKHPHVSAILLKFAHVFSIQITQTAVSNNFCTVPQRTARLILMAADRLETNELQFSHELIAEQLGVRRAGVSDALAELERRGVLRAIRMHIKLLDRPGMQKIAGGSYGIPEAAYVREFEADWGKKFEAKRKVTLPNGRQIFGGEDPLR